MSYRLEKLTISLSMHVKGEYIASDCEKKFEIPHKFSGMANEVILQNLIDAWPGEARIAQFFRSDGSVVVASELSRTLKSGGGWVGPLQANGIKFHVAELRSMKQIVISIEEIAVGSAGSWDKWVQSFLEDDTFIQAWTADVEYDYWQNASDILEYEANGRAYAHLPLVSNGLPFPLAKDIIDISHNPCRVEIRQGYIEAIGSKMWIGKRFIRTISRENLVKLLENLGYVTKNITAGVVQIILSEKPFGIYNVNEQKSLRNALYGYS